MLVKYSAHCLARNICPENGTASTTDLWDSQKVPSRPNSAFGLEIAPPTPSLSPSPTETLSSLPLMQATPVKLTQTILISQPQQVCLSSS